MRHARDRSCGRYHCRAIKPTGFAEPTHGGSCQCDLTIQVIAKLKRALDAARCCINACNQPSGLVLLRVLVRAYRIAETESHMLQVMLAPGYGRRLCGQSWIRFVVGRTYS